MTGAISEPMHISLDRIEEILAEQGYDVSEGNDGVLRIRDVDTGIVVRGVLEDTVLFLTLACTALTEGDITPDLMRTMLNADNGVSTSHFQFCPQTGGKVAVTLNNFCKLQNLGPEDADDILSCVEFLLADAMAAKQLLQA